MAVQRDQPAERHECRLRNSGRCRDQHRKVFRVRDQLGGQRDEFQCAADGDCPADAGLAVFARLSAAESGRYAEQQLRRAIQQLFGGHQLGQSPLPDQFAVQPVSVP